MNEELVVKTGFSKMAGKCLYRTSLYFRTIDLHETNILSTNRTTETRINYVSKQFTGLGVLLQ